MCPACIGNAMLMAGSVASTGGLSAIIFRRILARFTPQKFRSQIQAKEMQHG